VTDVVKERETDEGLLLTVREKGQDSLRSIYFE
jgi:hypothetical protein